MPAVVRVKRRINEEPLSAFVLNGKKRRLDSDAGAVANNAAGPKTDDSNKDEISTVLKFAGTVRERHNSSSNIVRMSKDAAKELVQNKSRKPTNHTERARQEMRQSLHENRFRVVNCMRTIVEDEEDIETFGTELTIVDIEKQSVPTDATDNTAVKDNTGGPSTSAVLTDLVQPADSDTGYVYDLYFPENTQQVENVDLMDDYNLSVRAFDDMFYEDRFNDIDDEDDSEDSNQESHFANDYPDEDVDVAVSDNDSEGTRDMRNAIRNFVLNDEDDDDDDEFNSASSRSTLSSDDENCNRFQDPYISTIDADEEGFVHDIDSLDADRYGTAYAKYKARILGRSRKSSEEDDCRETTDED